MPSEETSALFKKYNVAVLIPTYNNSKTVGDVIASVTAIAPDVLVVNDGSTDKTAEILKQFSGITVLDYKRNVGKGFALRTGFRKALEMGFDYVITIDSDGQHFVEDLPRFLEKLADNREAIIMGVRNMAQAGIPGKSSFGHKFSNFWFWVETGIRMNDTQSGYRLYPIRKIAPIHFVTRKFEFEIEVMVRSVWRGVSMAEVPVKIFYAAREERISHFRPFKDFTRISILNTVLVTIALIYIHPRDLLLGKKKAFWGTLKKAIVNPEESNFTKAASVGFGVFMGIVPLWGFQLLIGIPLAFLFKLNKALFIIAANISIPPMIPIILFLSHFTGGLWLGENARHISFNEPVTLSSVAAHSFQYVIGAITLSIAAGMFFGMLTWIGLKLFRKQRS